MRTHTCCHKQEVKRGPWSSLEDIKLIECISTHGQGNWASIPTLAGLQRCGRSCRFRWVNHLRPDLKKGGLTSEEKLFIVELQRRVGNRWAHIAKHLPRRTHNEIKNFWSTHIKNNLQVENSLPKKDSTISSSSGKSVINAPSNQVNTPNLPMTLQGLAHVQPHMTIDKENLAPTSLEIPVVSCAPHQLLHDNHLYSNFQVDAYMQELSMLLDPFVPHPSNITKKSYENASGGPISSPDRELLEKLNTELLGISPKINACENDFDFTNQSRSWYPNYMSYITSMMGPFSSTTTLSSTSTSTYSGSGSTILAPPSHDAPLF